MSTEPRKRDWKIYCPDLPMQPGQDPLQDLPPPPRWRRFDTTRAEDRAKTYKPNKKTIEMVNAALYLRRPLLVTGRPGSGKSTLAFNIADQLQLGRVLTWPINTRSTLAEGLYRYDAIGRLRSAQVVREQQPPSVTASSDGGAERVEDVARYIRLGPLGTAMVERDRPRVLLIDEIDKGDIDLPNDLLHVIEEGEFPIPEITRLLPKRAKEDSGTSPIRVPVEVQTDDDEWVPILNGRVHCKAFPIVILTSNGERDFPPAFLRRCLRLDIQPHTPEELTSIVESHLGAEITDDARQMVAKAISDFGDDRDKKKKGDFATDQLLNLIYFIKGDITIPDAVLSELRSELLRTLA